MKKRPKALKIVSLCLAFVLIAGVVAVALVLEPAVKIRGMAVLERDRLGGAVARPLVYDKNGVEVRAFSNHAYVPLADIAVHTQNAFIAVEDKRFYEHGGVDYYRIAGAGLRNIKSRSLGEGASTISQQLIKNTHLSGEKTFRRKVSEMRLAVDLERKYTKSEILEMYLNMLYFGNSVYGIGAAARVYFLKDAKDLTVNESAFLAGVINNPARYNPITSPGNANNRRKLVLARMLDGKFITKEEHDKCVSSDISIARVVFDQYEGFLTAECCAALGMSRADFFRSGFRVHSCRDEKLQKRVNALLMDYEYLEKENTIIHALVAGTDGSILADCATTSLPLTSNYRQPGSVIKPAICYAPAFEKKLISPSTPLLDEPTDFGGYSPRNYKDKNLGWISASEALKASQNVPAVALMQRCGVDYAKQTAERLGYTFDGEDNSLALALGAMHKGALLMDSANAYQAFAAGGEYIKLSHIDSIESENGTVLYKNPRRKKRAVSKETAYFINEILTDCAKNGTARRIGRGAAAKTGTVGTENGNTDAYVVAYTRDYVVAVWVGAKSGLMPNNISGGTHPCILARRILDLLPPSAPFDEPQKIVRVDLDSKEYKDNHKLVIASKKTYPKDKITASFATDNIPNERKLNDDYMLDTEKIDVQNFRIVGRKYSAPA